MIKYLCSHEKLLFKMKIKKMHEKSRKNGNGFVL